MPEGPGRGAAGELPPIHAEPLDALLTRLGVSPTQGLTEEEAADRRASAGRNELPSPPQPSAWKKLAAQFANPIVLTLLAAAVIAIVDGAGRVGEPVLLRFGDAIAILIIVCLLKGEKPGWRWGDKK